MLCLGPPVEIYFGMGIELVVVIPTITQPLDNLQLHFYFPTQGFAVTTDGEIAPVTRGMAELVTPKISFCRGTFAVLN